MTQPPPISPGPHPAAPDTPPPQFKDFAAGPGPAKRSRRWLAIALIVAAALITVASYLMWAVFATSLGIGQTDLRAAYGKCGQVGQLADGDKTLILDLAGKKAGSGTATLADLSCYVTQLGIPTYVTSKMEQTTALDGQVTDTWEGYEATWTYHPDRGLDVIIRQV